jgi:hypothetical protein
VIWSIRSNRSSTPSDGTQNAKDGKGEAPPIYVQKTSPPPLHPTLSSSLHHASVPASTPPDLGVKSGCSTLNLSIEAVQETTSKSTLTVDNMNSDFHRPHDNQPSPYLQNLCPLCFNITFDKLKETLKGLPNAELSDPIPSFLVNSSILPCCFQTSLCCFTLS